MSREPGPVPAWARQSTFLLSILGLGISTYLTITHFVGTQILACSSTGAVDCAAVTTSPQSYFLHVPVAVLGLAQFVVLTALNSPWGWRSRWYPLHVARVALAAVGVAFVLWLVAAELLIIDHICLWCTGVHIVSVALLLILTSVAPAQLGRARGGSGSAARAR